MNLYHWYLCYCLIVIKINFISGSLVSLDRGKLIGVRLQSRNGSPFWAYFGIPYAKPPIGALRFQPPQRPDPWSGIKDASKPTQKCAQWDKLMRNNEFGGSEDCLYLNVFTPAPDEKANIPVMVCIHSGGFLRGESAECFPTYFMDKRIVIVSFDYRLGIFGFLSAEDEVLPGNYGMKDQVAALQWVKENIKQFGGNPNLVTIFGQSAGGASVHLHMHSPSSQGLFHRAISQSGSAIAPWVITAPMLARNRTNVLGILTGCPLTSSELLVRCLRDLPAEELLKVYPKFYIWNYEPATIFTVVVEPNVKGAFITRHPLEIRELSSVPWLLGITSGEGGMVAADLLSRGGELVVQFDKNHKRYMPLLFCYAYTAKYEDINLITDTIKEYYFGNHNIGFMTAFQLRDMVTDGAIAHSSIKSALNYNGTRYFYYYDHLNERSFNEIWGENVFMRYLGVSHGDDLISLFPMWIFPPLNLIDYHVSVRMIDYWTNFAYHGNPNNEPSSQAYWDPITSPNLEYLHIQTVSDEMESNLLKARYQFWESLPLIIKYESTISANLTEKESNVMDVMTNSTIEKSTHIADEL